MSEVAQETWPDWQRLALLALIGSAVGWGACALGALFDPTQFFQSYLVAFHTWISIPLGSLAILLLHNLTGGRWGFALRRILEASARSMPVFIALFVPIALGAYHIYPWTDQELMDSDEILRQKAVYLNMPFFLARTVAYFAIWIGCTWLAMRGSSDQSATVTEEDRRVAMGSGFGLAFYGLAVTFAAVDWLMSLEPHWYSTIFGALVWASQILPAMAFALAVLSWLSRRPPISEAVAPIVWNDLGNLLLAFVMVWAYMSFSQFLLIWSGNLPEEITWYKNRIQGAWEWVAWLIIVFYFFLPFFLLLSRDLKQKPSRMLRVTASLLLMHLIFQYWLITPAFSENERNSHSAANGVVPWLAPFAQAAVGGVWLATFIGLFRAREPVAYAQLRAGEEIHHG
jgi:hypothetical protein